jgi:lysosomal alpha-mannosidase
MSYLDRSEGGGSIHDGSIEIMVHRRILHDDGLGVGDPLNETAFGQGLVVRGKHFLILESPANSALIHRVDAQQLFMQPIATYALPTTSYANYSNTYRQTWSALSDSMPLNVHLLTFDQLDPKQFLIRVEHYFELNEDEIYSQPVKIDLQMLFKSLGTITNFTELTLAANLPLSDLHRLDWITSDNESSHVDMTSESYFDQESRLYIFL